MSGRVHHLLLFAVSVLPMLVLLPCARKAVLHPDVKAVRIEEDAIAATYVDFIKSELERYGETPVKSLEAVNRAIDKNPDIGTFYYQRALINAGIGKWEDVAGDCEKALQKNPNDIDAKVLLARASGVMRQHDRAIKLLESARRSEPEREEIYSLLAKEYMNAERYHDAERVMNDLLRRDSEALVAYYYLGAIYGAYLRQPLKAIEIYNRLLEREPENYQVIDAVSQLYMDAGDFEKALSALLELEKTRPQDVSLKLKIAQINYRLKDYQSAIDRFKKILELEPKSDKIIYYLGVLYEEAGRLNDALTMFEKVPPKSGLYKDARLRLAYNYKQAGDIKRSKGILHEAVRKSPKTPEFYQYLSGMLEAEKDYEGAIKVLERAVRVFPDNYKVYYAIGVLYDKMDDTESAIEWMRKVLTVDPKNASAMNYIGYMLTESGRDLDEAERLLQEAAHLKPEDGYIIDSLGWLYFKKGDLTRAIALLKKALGLMPNEPTILKHIGQFYLERGDTKEAMKYFRRALDEWRKKEVVDEREIENIISIIEKAGLAER